MMLILGVGNPFRRDDGIGPEVIKLCNYQDADVVDGGTDGLALLDIIPKYKYAIIIDAVDMNMVPGAIRCFTPQEAKIPIQSDALSTHGFGLAEVLTFLEPLNVDTRIHIIGIQPQDTSFGEGLTDVVASQIPRILEYVQRLVQ